MGLFSSKFKNLGNRLGSSANLGTEGGKSPELCKLTVGHRLTERGSEEGSYWPKTEFPLLANPSKLRPEQWVWGRGGTKQIRRRNFSAVGGEGDWPSMEFPKSGPAALLGCLRRR